MMRRRAIKAAGAAPEGAMDGTVAIGSTSEREWDDPTSTDGQLDGLIAKARAACPVLALWGNAGIPSETERPLDTWRAWCERVEGHGIDSGHFMAEENPRAVLAALLPFLHAHSH